MADDLNSLLSAIVISGSALSHQITLTLQSTTIKQSNPKITDRENRTSNVIEYMARFFNYEVDILSLLTNRRECRQNPVYDKSFPLSAVTSSSHMLEITLLISCLWYSIVIFLIFIIFSLRIWEHMLMLHYIYCTFYSTLVSTLLKLMFHSLWLLVLL